MGTFEKRNRGKLHANIGWQQKHNSKEYKRKYIKNLY